MDKKTAQNLIEDTFNDSFSEEKFIRFSQELLNDIDFSHGRNWSTLIYDDFEDKISKYKRVGLYTDPEGNELEVLIIEVQKIQMLERSRTSMRNFVIKWLQSDKNKSKSRDYALVAFYSKEDNGIDWRFSFIKVEQTSFMDEEKGKVKTKKEFTPAKRYSFLVGKYEKAHTAKNQLLPLLQNISNNPTIEELEAAFSIEKVTDEFFNQYKDLYIKLFEHFENDSQVKTEFEKAAIDNARFTKKLLGQIVFLYFLQKKGWLGVAKNERWGTGKKRFVQELYDQAQTDDVNFFKDKLQYLFYEALAKERDNVNSYYKRFDCRIPFLNGGLFEADYHWETANITIPEYIFRNKDRNKSGDEGTGVLDVFDRYNFTIKEDEPLDKEVAVDPEMLGKVFENMLDITERKRKGAFYTPREIVHYMCQESLIHYLDNALENKVKKEDIEDFIRKGHSYLENDINALKKIDKIKAGEQKSTDAELKLPESIRQNADLIDQKLSNIKICDPAIGSGAFPVGLLHELVNAMLVLKPHLSYEYLTEKLKNFGFEYRESISDSRYIYRLKRHIIQESIYGVDIDASAIDIARLRLWLSLVVDEDDLDPIETLPNLDYKIVCGNSLIGFPESWQSPAFEKIEKLKDEFYNVTDYERKQQLKQEIEGEIQERLKSSKRVFGYQVDFDFKLFFSEVWREKGGFDVVIGNPPYISYYSRQAQDIDEKDLFAMKTISKFINNKMKKGRFHSVQFFLDRCKDLTRVSGFTNFIIDTSFFENAFQEIREFVLKNYTIVEIISELNSFNGVASGQLIISFKNTALKDKSEKLIWRENFESSPKFLNQNVWLKDVKFEISNKNNFLINKIERSAYTLNNICDVKVGVNIGGVKEYFLSNDSRYFKFINGSNNVKRFRIIYPTKKQEEKEELYIDFNKVTEKEIWDKKMGTPSIGESNERFLEPKIVIRQSDTKLSAAYDENQYHCDYNLFTANLINEGDKNILKSITCIINSEVLTYFVIENKWLNLKPGKTPQIRVSDVKNLPIPKNLDANLVILYDYLNFLASSEDEIKYNTFYQINNSIAFELYFPEEIKSAGKEILKHLGDLKPITEDMSEEKKLAIIQSEFERLYDPNHPVRFAIETLDSVEEVRIIKEALK